MTKRLEDKVAIVIGAGQTPGDTVGNGRAISILFARHGAKVMLVDRRQDSAEETKSMIDGEGGEAIVFEGDVTSEEDCRRMAEDCVKAYDRIDILVNVVGIGAGDAGPVKLSVEAWNHIFNVNLTGMFLSCKYVLPVMEKQESGSIVNISSAAAVASAPYLAYKTSKAGVNAMTHAIAMRYAGKGIRANVIMPGLMHTPMAIEGISSAMAISKDDLIKMRDDRVPLKGGMGTGWDTAYAALFLSSDEAKFITAVVLPVDGGQTGRIG